MINICNNLNNRDISPAIHIEQAYAAAILAIQKLKNGTLPGGEYIISYHGKNHDNLDWGMTYVETFHKDCYSENMIYITRMDGEKVFTSKRGNPSNHVSINTLFPILKESSIWV